MPLGLPRPAPRTLSLARGKRRWLFSRVSAPSLPGASRSSALPGPRRGPRRPRRWAGPGGRQQLPADLPHGSPSAQTTCVPEREGSRHAAPRGGQASGALCSRESGPGESSPCPAPGAAGGPSSATVPHARVSKPPTSSSPSPPPTSAAGRAPRTEQGAPSGSTTPSVEELHLPRNQGHSGGRHHLLRRASWTLNTLRWGDTPGAQVRPEA